MREIKQPYQSVDAIEGNAVENVKSL